MLLVVVVAVVDVPLEAVVALVQAVVAVQQVVVAEEEVVVVVEEVVEEEAVECYPTMPPNHHHSISYYSTNHARTIKHSVYLSYSLSIALSLSPICFSNMHCSAN